MRVVAAAFSCALLSAPALADDVADAKAFVETVYARYADGTVTSPDWNMDTFDAPMLALMDEDKRLNPEGSYVLDWDPICQCQDFARLRATVRIVKIAGATAIADVDFRDDGMTDAHDATARLDLVREAGGWRIHDIHSKDFANPGHSMRERFIEAIRERHGRVP